MELAPGATLELFARVAMGNAADDVEPVRGLFPELVPVIESLLERDPAIRMACTGWTRPLGPTLGEGDCDDADGAIHPGALERCNGQDDDCDGTPADEFADTDLDGHPRCGEDLAPIDCTDLDASSTWIADDPDCDGLIEDTVEWVTWHEALAFANAVSLAEGLPQCYLLSGCDVSNAGDGMGDCNVSVPAGSVYDCEGYRLPTEAEWEYAARAGTENKYAGSNLVTDVAWYALNSGGTTHPVAADPPLAANGWDLCDMSGNVWEWGWDWYDVQYYSVSPLSDPEGPSSETPLGEVMGGGSWNDPSTPRASPVAPDQRRPPRLRPRLPPGQDGAPTTLSPWGAP